MKPQTPAQGIMKLNDFGDSVWYKVDCSCGQDDDAIEFEVEADPTGIFVNTYTIQKTPWWNDFIKKRYDIENTWLQKFDWFWKDVVNGLVTRLTITWQLWVHGYVRYYSTTVMNKQQALNYAETLKSAISHMEGIQNGSKKVKN